MSRKKKKRVESVYEADEACPHGVVGGCNLVCEECSHVCKEHDELGCWHDEPEACECMDFAKGPG